MNLILLTIGKTRTSYVAEGIGEYLTRLRRYVPYEIAELPDVKNAGKIGPEEQKEAEGRQILNYLSPSDHVVLLDERGKEFTSVEFADRLQSIMASGKKRMVMVVGGPYGFSQEVYRRGNEMLSLSRMTFNHEMVRLFVTEQVYRAMTILRGEPYHHQ